MIEKGHLPSLKIGKPRMVNIAALSQDTMDNGDRNTAFECLIKIQGMMAAFDEPDGALCAYAKLAESAFITYTQTRAREGRHKAT